MVLSATPDRAKNQEGPSKAKATEGRGSKGRFFFWTHRHPLKDDEWPFSISSSLQTYSSSVTILPPSPFLSIFPSPF